jgi:hypothetical protein
VYLLGLRLFRLFRSPARVYWLGRGAATLARTSSDGRCGSTRFRFWLFNWSNTSSSTASSPTPTSSVGTAEFRLRDVLPVATRARPNAAPANKMRAQRRLTAAALRDFVESREQR